MEELTLKVETVDPILALKNSEYEPPEGTAFIFVHNDDESFGLRTRTNGAKSLYFLAKAIASEPEFAKLLTKAILFILALGDAAPDEGMSDTE